MNDFFVKLDGQVVEMPMGQSITLERYNPVFDFETIRGSKVLDFIIPFGKVADRIFGWYGLQRTRFEPRKILCEKYANMQLIERGFVELLDVKEDGYQVFFTQNLGDFFGIYQDVLLDDIDFGGAIANKVAEYDYTVDAVAWPKVKNIGFFGDAAPVGFDGYINASNVIVPMVGLPFLFRKIAEICKVRFAGEFFDSVYYRRGLVDNTFLAVEGEAMKFQNHLPAMTIPTFLKELGKLLNVAIYIDTIERVVTMRMREERMQQETGLDLTGVVVPGMSRKPEGKRLELDWELDGGDGLMKVKPAGFDRYVYAPPQPSPAGEGATNLFSIKSRFSTRLVENGIATMQQLGMKTIGQNKFSAKLLLWNGVVDGAGVATNAAEGRVLAWHGAGGLQENYQYFEKWRAGTASRVLNARLTAFHIAQLDFHAKSGENSIIHVAGRNYFVESIRANLPIVGMSSIGVFEV